MCSYLSDYIYLPYFTYYMYHLFSCSINLCAAYLFEYIYVYPILTLECINYLVSTLIICVTYLIGI